LHSSKILAYEKIAHAITYFTGMITGSHIAQIVCFTFMSNTGRVSFPSTGTEMLDGGLSVYCYVVSRGAVRSNGAAILTHSRHRGRDNASTCSHVSGVAIEPLLTRRASLLTRSRCEKIATFV